MTHPTHFFFKTLVSTVVLASAVAASEGIALADDSAPAAVASPAAPPAAPASEPPVRTVIVYAPPPAPAAKGEWYGWQTLTVDGASTALVLAGVGVGAGANGTAGAALSLAGVTGFAVGAPIVHAVHGQWGIAAADLGLRAGAVALGAFVGHEVGRATSSGCSSNSVPLGCLGSSLDGLAIGATAGAVIASVLDAALLSQDKPVPQETPAPSFSWTPSVSMVKGGGTGGVTGTF